MTSPFFDRPTLNSPSENPDKRWELDQEGQPTQRAIEQRREARFVLPVPKPTRHPMNGYRLYSREAVLELKKQILAEPEAQR